MNNAPIKTSCLAVGFALIAGFTGNLVRNTAAADDKECYGFEKLEVGARYEFGDVIQAEHSVVTIKQLQREPGQPTGAKSEFVTVASSNIAGGSSRPELRFYLVNAEVRPNVGVRKVRFKFAEPHHSQLSNFAVNGDKRVLTGNLQTLDQQLIGTPGTGLARVTVKTTFAPGPDGFDHGVLELEAVAGKIDSFAIGGRQYIVDDMCMLK